VDERQAKKRIKELRGFYVHAGVFVATNLFLLMINLMEYSPGGELWFVYPLFGWGIGVVAHAMQVYVGGLDWEARKMAQLTGLEDARDEMAQLSERLDRLVTILASVDWSKIDAELLNTRDALVAARRSLEDLQERADPEDQRRVREEVEKLEAFVTSSKFAYYDMAANGAGTEPRAER